MNYIYPNIQFLRAISVLLVFFYHLKIDLFKFGYIGVDIFFVISGFVISSRIYNELIKRKSIDLLSFYTKRFKRIFPVLLFILTFVLLFAIFFQPLDLLVENIYVFIFTIFGSANLYYLFSKKDYFDNIFEDVFGHTWSLGVEEQFYLIFPFLLLFIYKFFKKKTAHIITISILIIIGILFTIYFSENKKLIFYSPVFRFWELLLGSITYIFSKNFKNKNFIISLLAFIFLFITSLNTSYMTNIIVVLLSPLLASLFLLFYEQNLKLKFFFENNSLVFLGNISYSFYLWHLPIIYFYDLYFVENFFRIPFVFFLTFVLSVLTYHYIEKKFRYKKFDLTFLKKITPSSISLLGIISLVFYFSIQINYKNEFKKTSKDIIYK
ncbi:acyltransferase, partial [Pelagibacterales bacterium SAG-MED20]|nr:acyltransferase [Pelagibacterales bacterium SAG-MED20]